MVTVEERANFLNGLLRGELAAMETYRQALGKLTEDPAAPELRDMEAAHQKAVEALREYIVQRGGRPVADSGVWGTWSKAFQVTAQLFGRTAALTALKEGEESGLRSYENALADANLDDDTKQFISSTLLPPTKAHLPILDRLLNDKQPEPAATPAPQKS